MIKLICGECKYVFWAAVVQGQGKTCPECGSINIHVAIHVEPNRETLEE